MGRVRANVAKPKEEVIENLEEGLDAIDDAVENAEDVVESAEDILEGIEEDEEGEEEQEHIPAAPKNMVKYRKLGGGILTLPGDVVITGVEGTEFTYEKDAIPIAFRDLVVEVD